MADTERDLVVAYEKALAAYREKGTPARTAKYVEARDALREHRRAARADEGRPATATVTGKE